MARSPLLLLFAVCFLAVVVVGNASRYQVTGGEGSLSPEQCGPACDYRCSAASNHEPCLMYCNQCCAKCLCVPSGTFGNKEECPCYDDWQTEKGTPKCP